jgi:hypothetical protein
MANLAVKSLSVVFAGIVASVPIAVIPLSTVDAAEECLTVPKDETPKGKHWYYRFERGTKRHCWYLRTEGETSSSAATSKLARRTAPEVPTNRVANLTGLAADARAEISPTTPAAPVDPRGAERKPSNNTSSETVQSPIASRWPEPTSVFSSATERPLSPSFVVASAAPDADLAPEISSVAPAKVETSAMGTPASFQRLLFGTFGAIALLSFTENAIYVMGRMRRRSQRHTRSTPPKWPKQGPASHTGIPRWLEPMAVNSIHCLDRGHDAVTPSLERQRSSLAYNSREIEQLLARFADQART